MRSRLLERGAQVLGLLVGALLDPMPEALADDDEVRVSVRFLRCYAGANDTKYAGYAVFDGPEPSSVNFGMAMVGRERGSDNWQSVGAEPKSVLAPGTYGFDWSDPRRFRSMRMAVAGVDSERARTFRADETVDCQEVGSREGVRAEIGLLCTRRSDEPGLFHTSVVVLADLVNHSDQFVQTSQARAVVQVRHRGDDDFQDAETLEFSILSVPQRSARIDTAGGYGGPYEDARKVRAEVEIQIPGRAQPLREDAEADCPDSD